MLEILNDPTPDNSYNDFWDKIKKIEEESIKKIKDMKGKRNVNYNEGKRR